MERTELKNLILIGLLTAVFAYFVYNGLGAAFPGVSGWRAEAVKLRAERDQLQRSVQSAQAQLGNLDKIRKDREALERQLKDLSKRLPGERESAEVLRSVEMLAGKSGLIVAQVRRRPVRTQELYVEIPMEVGVNGGYHDMVRFTDQLSKLDRLVTLNEFKVEQRTASGGGQPAPGTAAAESGTIKAQLVTVVFQALPDRGLAAPGAPGTAPK